MERIRAGDIQNIMAEHTHDPGPYHPLRVREVIRETGDACSLVLEIPESLRETYDYRAGQFLTFNIPVDGHHLVRCYSLASSPDCDEPHKVTVKRVEDGRVSNWLNDRVESGFELQVMKPAGHFCLREVDSPIVLFGAGSGITPVISILKTALRTSERPVKLIYANRDESSIIFEQELAELAAAHADRLTIEHRLDDRNGFLDVDAARSHAGSQSGGDFYVCGPGPFMDVVERALSALDIPSEQIFIERFEYEAHEPAAAVTGAGSETIVAEIYLDGDVMKVPCADGETLLEAADRAGMEAPCACRDGYCGACMAKVVEGEVEMKLNDGGLDDAQVAEGWVLTCQGIPKTPKVRIDYPDPD
jgi:3-ketosteroid 9alpha-monooxygenase subunit B